MNLVPHCAPRFDAELIRRYGGPAPRYTSYPTALQFTEAWDESQLRRTAAALPAAAPLSLYVHLPFCASPCFYCACTRIITRQPALAQAYLARLYREIELQGELFEGAGPVEQLHFGGGTPTYYDAATLGEVMAALDRHFTLSEDESREYSIEVDPRTVHTDSMAELAGLGFNRLSLGVQDFDPAVQRAVNRVQSLKDTFDLIGAARAAGFRSVSVDLIYGLPLQTPPSFERTLDLVRVARPDRIAVYAYAHLPQRFKAQRQIERSLVPAPETRLELLRLSIEKLTAAGYVYIGMDHFARPEDELVRAQRSGELQRNFQGYSTRGGRDLVGLGLSAISRVGDAYSQNAKALPAYQRALDAGRLPVERGLRLTTDDRLRREVIEQLMCHGRVRFADLEGRYGIEFRAYFARELARLRELENDGLVRLSDAAVEVTPSGRLLLRAVARMFDVYAPRDAAGAARFSRVA